MGRRGERLRLKTRAALVEPSLELQVFLPSGDPLKFQAYRVIVFPMRHCLILKKLLTPRSSCSLPGARETSGTGELAQLSGASSSQKQVLSPFVGTFYRAASPDSDSYVKGSDSKTGRCTLYY